MRIKSFAILMVLHLPVMLGVRFAVGRPTGISASLGAALAILILAELALLGGLRWLIGTGRVGAGMAQAFRESLPAVFGATAMTTLDLSPSALDWTSLLRNAAVFAVAMVAAQGVVKLVLPPGAGPVQTRSEAGMPPGGPRRSDYPSAGP